MPMNYLKRIRILRDERAQAMTEYVIMIPIIILVFSAALQTMFVAQAAQLANYAAFTAARSYATKYSQFKRNDASTAHDEAMDKAQIAATLVMAPVSHAVMGESVSLFQPLRTAAAGAGQAVESFYGVLEGFTIAFIFRMKEFNITQPNPSDVDDGAIITCTFDYMCPLAIPGLAEMWNYLEDYNDPPTGTDSEYFDDSFEANPPFTDADLLADAMSALSGLFGALGSLLGNSPAGSSMQDLQDFMNSAAGAAPLGAQANIRITAKCAMGFEPWNGLPRIAGRDDTATGDAALNQCADGITQRNTALDTQKQVAATQCDVALVASNAYQTAVGVYNQCVATSTNPVVECADELVDRDTKLITWNSEQSDCEDESDEADRLAKDLETFSANCP